MNQDTFKYQKKKLKFKFLKNSLKKFKQLELYVWFLFDLIVKSAALAIGNDQLLNDSTRCERLSNECDFEISNNSKLIFYFFLLLIKLH